VLWFEIDASGDANVVLLIKPLGLGLDENAVEAVKTWKFKPATRNGIPVRVRAMAEITFHLK
jgi:TonB family protein